MVKMGSGQITTDSVNTKLIEAFNFKYSLQLNIISLPGVCMGLQQLWSDWQWDH